MSNRVGLVGGGARGVHLLKVFLSSNSISVRFLVAETDAVAALELARKHSIPVYGNIVQAIASGVVDFVVETTGSADAKKEIIRAFCDANIDRDASVLVDHRIAEMLLTVLGGHVQRTTSEARGEIGTIKQNMRASLKGMAKLLATGAEVSDGMRILALNAVISARSERRGERDLVVIANEMKSLAERIMSVTRGIEQVHSDVEAIGRQLDVSLAKLDFKDNGAPG